LPTNHYNGITEGVVCLKLAEIKASKDEQLIGALYWIAVKATKEANGARGLTKQTEKTEERILNEIQQRFNLDEGEFRKIMDKARR
jgi:hypothetical protein